MGVRYFNLKLGKPDSIGISLRIDTSAVPEQRIIDMTECYEVIRAINTKGKTTYYLQRSERHQPEAQLSVDEENLVSIVQNWGGNQSSVNEISEKEAQEIAEKIDCMKIAMDYMAPDIYPPEEFSRGQ